eukprot:5811344-Pyramimonas_sp.AAC.1
MAPAHIRSRAQEAHQKQLASKPESGSAGGRGKGRSQGKDASNELSRVRAQLDELVKALGRGKLPDKSDKPEGKAKRAPWYKDQVSRDREAAEAAQQADP